jgi:hypothetical protein
MSFITGTQAELLYNLNTAITKNTYTTQAAFTGVLGTNTVCAIPPGFLLYGNPTPVGRSLKLEVVGSVANTAAATFAVALGMDVTAGTIANSIAVATAYAPTAATTAPFRVEAWYTCTAYTTSSATWQVNGRYYQEAVASGGAPSASALSVGFIGTQTGDPRVAQYVELFGTWSASAAGNTTTVNQMFLWGLN